MSVHVVELSPLKASVLRWLPQRGGPMVTIICKATFPLAPGLAELAPAQDDVNQRDLHAENNPKKGLYSASDLAPFKRQPDVTLVGRCFAKPDELSKMLVARLNVAGIDKHIEVHADRFFTKDGQLSDETFFTKMALGYERAAGGPKTLNPVGVDTQGPAREDGTIPAPNLQKPGEVLARPDQPLSPIGFGPIPEKWHRRRGLLSQHGQAWLQTDWTQARVPEDLNWSYFNVAPEDQRPRALRDDERLHLEHLHPEHPTLTMQLPGLRPCVYVEQGGQGRLVQVHADTLWIDTNRLAVTLCWRGQIEVAEAHAARVLVAMARAGEQLSFAHVIELAKNVQQQQAAKKQQEAEKKEHAASEAKTQIRPARSSSGGPVSSASGSRMTSPVPLVPSSDMTPAWMPPPSSQKSPASAPSSGPPSARASEGHSLQVPLTPGEAHQLQQLAQTLGCSVQDALRYALQESYRARFPQGPGTPQGSG